MICGNVDVAKLHHAFDHFAGVFLEQALAMAFGDDRADVLFERLFVGGGQVAAGHAVQGHVDHPRRPCQRRQNEAHAPQQRPSKEEEPVGPQPGEAPRQPDVGRQHGQQQRQQRREQRAGGEAASWPCCQTASPPAAAATARAAVRSDCIASPTRSASAAHGPIARACSAAGRFPQALPGRSRPPRGPPEPPGT